MSSALDAKPDTASSILACIDSGVGGLAVLRQLVRVMPDSPFLFLGDTAWMPYGEKPLPVIRKRVLQVYDWLDAHHSPAALVLACNTATVATWADLQTRNLGYPVFEPVSTTAAWINTHTEPGQTIGILATPATVEGNRYRELIDASHQVFQVACPGLASRIESGDTDSPTLRHQVETLLEPLQAAGIQMLVLACTHYSFIQHVVEAQLGPGVQIVDSSTILAQTAMPYLSGLHLRHGTQQLTVTGDAHRFVQAIARLPLAELRHLTVQSCSLGDPIAAPVSLVNP